MVLLDTETPGTSREIYSEDAEGEARTLCNPGVASSSLTFGTVNLAEIQTHLAEEKLPHQFQLSITAQFQLSMS